MTAILKREFASYFTSPLGYVYLAVFYGFSGLFLWITCLSSGSADMQYVFLWMFFIMMILIPILTMRTMADDKRQKTDQLTLTSPVSLFGLVAGKFLAAFFIFLIGAAVIFFFNRIPVYSMHIFQIESVTESPPCFIEYLSPFLTVINGSNHIA